MRKKIKTLVYPFDDECEAFLEFHSWMEYIDIIAEGIELLWIVESTNKITLNEFEKRLIFLTKDIKNILVSRKLSAEEFDKLEEIAKINSVKIIEEKDIIGTLSEQSFEESGEGYALKDIEIPIVMIAGAGENCNKFELELLIANKLKEIGYKVSIVTSRSHVNCLGVHSFPLKPKGINPFKRLIENNNFGLQGIKYTFMFQSLKDENEKIIAYNNYIKYLSEIDKPDIFVLGVPGGILPITRRQPEHFGIFAFEVFNSVKPDYMIFNLYNADVERKYLSEMKMLMKYRFDVDIDAFYISNYIQDGLSLNTFMPIKYIRQEQQDVEEKWEKFGEGIYYKSKITLLVENLIQTLNGYKEIEIL